MRRHALSLATCALLVGCEKPPAPSEQEPPAPAPEPPPTCRPPPAGDVVAQWTAPDGCPFVATVTNTTLRLDSLALAPTIAAIGTTPECSVAACRYEGVNSELGPMLIATEPGAESEVPTAVFLGVVAGTQVVFVDLWAGAGPSVTEDSTAIGPTHGLEPLRCGNELGLFARARVPGMAHLGVPPELAAREGIMALGPGGGAVRPGAATGCAALDVPLP